MDVDYGYDGLGRLESQSVPHATTAGWVNRPAYWNGYSETQYDALGRVTQSFAPNREQTVYSQVGRQTKVTGVGRNGYPNKVLRWTETDGLGNLAIVRTGDSSGAETTRVTLDYDAVGNLKTVDMPWVGVTTLTYDLGGRKRSMSDPDLGTWTYDYYRRGELKQQVDGCGNVLAMSYDGLGRLVQETATPGSGCPDSRLTTTAATTTSYLYENGPGPNGHSRGQLVYVSYADNSYNKSLTYNGDGQLASETVWIAGAPQLYTTSYTYDGYDRPQTTVYPDGDVVTTTGYDSPGWPTGLTTSLWGQTQVLVDSARYDAAAGAVALPLRRRAVREPLLPFVDRCGRQQQRPLLGGERGAWAGCP